MASGQLTDNGSTDWVLIAAGEGLLFLSGDFGSGTATVESKSASGAAVEVTDGQFTAAACHSMQFLADVYVRITLTSATSPELDWEIRTTTKSGVRVA
jgi:hypothetical protein